MAIVRGGEKFEAAMLALAEKINQPATLRVGFLEGGVNSHTGASIPTYAAINNYGAPAKGIPPRPFFSNMVAAKSPEWPNGIAGLLKATNYDVNTTLRQTGEIIAGQLQDSILNGGWAPNKPSTLARKKSRSTQPLIDYTDMYKAVSFEIKS